MPANILGWDCCQCGFPGFYLYDIACSDCSHRSCPGCPIYTAEVGTGVSTRTSTRTSASARHGGTSTRRDQPQHHLFSTAPSTPPTWTQVFAHTSASLRAVDEDISDLDSETDDGAYISVFAHILLKATDTRKLNRHLVKNLPDLIHSYGIRAASSNKQSLEMTPVGIFATENKQRITDAFLELAKGRSSELSSDSHTNLLPPTKPVAVGPKDSAASGPPVPSWLHGVENVASFSWLSGTVKAREHLDFESAVVMNAIKDKVLSAFDAVGGLDMSSARRAKIELGWNPHRFIKEQGYRADETLSTALTITGNAATPQLLAAVQYLEQTWPLVGPWILRLVMETCAQLEPAQSISRTMFDGTAVTVSIGRTDHTTTVRCEGCPDPIVEIIEVLAWLNSALREAPGSEIMHSVTKLRCYPSSSAMDMEAIFILTAEEEPIIRQSLLSEDSTSSESVPGRCWHHLFNNPTIAKGFPTPWRPDDTEGLQLSLEAMGTLVGASRLAIFENRVVLKGFNAAIFPAAQMGETLLWHLVVNGDGSRISFSDPRIRGSMPVETTNLMHWISEKRHILGWASDVSYNIGSPKANYNIGWSNAAHVGPGCALEKLIISGGPGFLSAGAEFALGRKDKSPLIKRESAYLPLLNWLSGAYMVLYDTMDHRAWLTNGLHTLLHLVRASLKHDKHISDLAAACLFDPAKLKEESDPLSPTAAIRFLLNPRNLEQPIFPDTREIRTEEVISASQHLKTEYRTSRKILLQDRVVQIGHSLEQLIDHQGGLDLYSSGVPLRFTPRDKLEGFRFMDIATSRTISPRMVSLDTFGGAGKSWVDFIRSIKAVTLFGEGFGDLLMPRNAAPGVMDQNDCGLWKTVPKGRDHLAVATHDLIKILRQEGCETSLPLNLSPGIYWEPTRLFETCGCQKGKRRSCDRVQTLLREPFVKPSPRNPATPLFDLHGKTGAIIFGRSNFFSYSWPARGSSTPAKRKAPAADTEQQPTSVGTPTPNLPATYVSLPALRLPGSPTRSTTPATNSGEAESTESPSSDPDMEPPPAKRTKRLWEAFRGRLSLGSRGAQHPP